ncbi:hypothetical protein MtrunA17_Chr7g0266261 [Medicago truncatula]|uniref:Uncharacterized protein n=1 Tax=Medicago truncatula TaxID=3880 RepID=A0A396H5W3_MEDTR|nr:hypothetical protein MtrunA17_Chr7g0266261 [Medicago truncatula]
MHNNSVDEVVTGLKKISKVPRKKIEIYRGYATRDMVSQCRVTRKLDIFSFSIKLLKIVNGRPNAQCNLHEGQ